MKWDICFRDRAEAGQALAATLREFREQADVLVLALPRGGVPVAYEVANTLALRLDLILVRKPGARPATKRWRWAPLPVAAYRCLTMTPSGNLHISPTAIETAPRGNPGVAAPRQGL